MKSSFKNVFVIPALLILSIALLVGCGGSSAAAPAADAAAPAAEAYAEPAAEAPAAIEAAAAEPVALQIGSSESVAAQSPAVDGRKIIANAHLELLVRDPKKLADAIAGLAAQSGGYISAANLKSKGDLVAETEKGSEMFVGTITLRVQPAKIESSLASLERLAMEVKSKSIDRQDVTDQYADLDAQLRNLTATEDELRVLLKEVREKPNSKPEDILTVHEKVTQIRAQIEGLQGRKNMLENLVSLSTIEIAILQWLPPQPPQPPQPQSVLVEPVWQPSLVVTAAKEALVVRFQQLTDRAIWLVIYRLPILLVYLIPLTIIGLIGRWVWRRVNLSSVLPVAR